MNRQAAALVVCGLAAASTCLGEVPWAAFIGEGPAIHAPFLHDGQVVTYGFVEVADRWSWDGTGGSTSSWGLARYQPSFADDNQYPAPMPADRDWVFEISMMQQDQFGTRDPWHIKNIDRDERIMALGNNQDGTYNLNAAEPDNTYDTVAAALSLPLDEWGDFVVHYKAGTETLDAYFNGDLVAEDFIVQVADVDWVQAEWLRQGWTSFRHIKLGQLSTGGPQCGPGDADEDGDVDDADLSLLLANWGSEFATCNEGEFSGEAPVNDDDLSLLLANWTGPLAAPVPEPATMAMLALAARVLPRARRKA